MLSTRQDIDQVVGVISRFIENPGKEDWNVVKWIPKYLRGTSDAAICYKSIYLQIKGFAIF